MRHRAVFLDKDGTLLEDVPGRPEPRPQRLLPGAVEGLRALHAAGYRIFLVTQQSGVARGHFSEEALLASAERLRRTLEELGAPLHGFYYCPHHPQGEVAAHARECGCRKPRPGMILRAAAENGVDLDASWMVGDILDDVEAGRRAGVRTVHIDSGGETEWVLSPERLPHRSARDLAEAAAMILGGAPAAHPVRRPFRWEP